MVVEVAVFFAVIFFAFAKFLSVEYVISYPSAFLTLVHLMVSAFFDALILLIFVLAEVTVIVEVAVALK